MSITIDEWKVFCEIIWNNVYGANTHSKHKKRLITETKKDDAFFNKFIGLIPEILFKNKYESFSNQLGILIDGGWFIAPEGDENPLSKNGIYVTVTLRNTEAFHSLYSHLRSLFDRPLYLLIAKHKDIQTDYFDKPFEYFYEVLKFDLDKDKNPNFISSTKDELFSIFTPNSFQYRHESFKRPKLAKQVDVIPKELGFESSDLISIYYDRLFYDYYLSKFFKKGNSSDIDAITLKNGLYNFIDIKRKYPSYEKQLGMNSKHISFFNGIEEWEGVKSYYVVNLVEYKNMNNIIFSNDWRYIEMKRFIDTTQKTTGKSGQTRETAIETSMVDLMDFHVLRQK